MITRVALLFALSVFFTAGTLRAEDCPGEMPEDGAARRVLAKKWFSKGQVAGDAGDDVAALKAYQCSLKFVPHGFTAYNLAQIAERIGDLEAAISSYNQYLLLVPDAKDALEVNQRVTTLQQRLAKARLQTEKDLETKPVSTPAVIEPPAQATPKREEPAPLAVATESPSNSYRTAGWIVYGGTAALIVGGVVSNLLARNKMDSCRSKYASAGVTADAVAACDDAKPLAYLSYGLFGAAAAAAVVGTVLVLHPTESSDVSFNMLPQGGLTLAWSGRFR